MVVQSKIIVLHKFYCIHRGHISPYSGKCFLDSDLTRPRYSYKSAATRPTAAPNPRGAMCFAAAPVNADGATVAALATVAGSDMGRIENEGVGMVVTTADEVT